MPAPNPDQYEFPEALEAIFADALDGAGRFMRHFATGFHEAEHRRKRLRIDKLGVDPSGQLELDLGKLGIETPELEAHAEPEFPDYLRPIPEDEWCLDRDRWPADPEPTPAAPPVPIKLDWS